MIAYDTMTQVSLAVLCAFLRPRWVAISGAGIFASQAVDELLGGNLYGDGRWEYPVAVAFTVAVYFITRGHDQQRWI